MELSFRELKNRDVINFVDGRCLGKPCDIIIDFPRGKMTAIVVPGKKSWGILRCFNKNEIVILERNIIKIGSDVILVNLKCGEVCAPSTNISSTNTSSRHNSCDAQKRDSCKPSCPSPCPPNCKPKGNESYPTCEQLFSSSQLGEDYDLSDY